MAPAQTHGSRTRERFGATKTKLAEPAKQKKHELEDSEDSDAEMQLQLHRSADENKEREQQPAWEGFGNEDDSSESEDSDEDVTMRERDIPAKDEAEEELERLVFGDSAGFKEGIDNFSRPDIRGLNLSEHSGSEQGEDEDLDEVADDNLFFFDSGPGAAAAGALAVTKPPKEAEEDEGDKPAWEDSDDDRMTVSLASQPRLRKLRETEEDDVVGGREYVRRLRIQYQRLYPTPEWVLQAQGKSKKRRRKSGAREDGEASGSDMDVDDEDEEDLSTQPIAKLLQDADILGRGASRGPAKRRKLQAGTVDIQKLRDVSGKGPSSITSLTFHPTLPLLLSCGPSSTLSLHHVLPSPPPGQTPNPLLTSLHVKKTPLATTAFHPSASSSKIFLSARRRYFHVWDLASGKVEKVSRIYGHAHEQRTMETFKLSPDAEGNFMALQGSSKKGGGVINILSAHTLQWVTQVRITSRHGIAEFCWWRDGSGLSIVGKNGEVTEWSVEKGVIGRWQDDGAVGTTVIALGGNSGRADWLGGDRWVALGSSPGIVNIYDRRAWAPSSSTCTSTDAPTLASEPSNGGIPTAPKPTRTLPNLTMPISHLAFSPDGQVLAMASQWKAGALRLVHLPSCTVFRNWPTEQTGLGRLSSLAWGRPAEEDEREGSLALLGIGFETGRIRLWEVRA